MTRIECDKSRPGISVFGTGEKIRSWLDTGLDNYERLEIFYSLLSTMTSLEVRYFHSVLHSFMSRDWHSVVEAQDLIRRTNDVFSMRDLYASMEPQGLFTNEMTRNQVILDLSVLLPISTSCADIICDFIDRAGISLHAGLIEDDQILSDLLMIVSMSFRHPAFRFHWRVRLGQIAVELVAQRMSFSRPPRLPSTATVGTSTASQTQTPSPTPDGVPPGERSAALEPPQIPQVSFATGEYSTVRLVTSASASASLVSSSPADPPKLKSVSNSNVPARTSHVSRTASALKPTVSRQAENPSQGSMPAKQVPENWRSASQGKTKSCYNCGDSGHWGQDCQKKPYWESEPYSDASDYCLPTDDACRNTPDAMRRSEIYYAQKYAKQWSNK